MRPARSVLLGAWLMGIGHAAAQSPPRTAVASGASIVENVSVIPMTKDTVIGPVSVLIDNGRITAIRSGLVAPAGARRIDGRGKYLMPGLLDMHAHLYADEWVADSAARYELGVFLANGVTTARLTIGTPLHLALRRSLADGVIEGPNLWIASPQLAGRADPNSLVVRSADEGRRAVREAAAAGYDFIKLTVLITPEVYEAIVAEATLAKIRVIGHVDPRVGVPRAIAAGQQIEHFDGFWEAMLKDGAPQTQSVSDVGVYRLQNWETLDWIDEGKLEALVRAAVAARVAVTPTHAFFVETFAAPVPDSVVQTRPDWNHIPLAMRDLYWRGRTQYWRNPPSAERRARYIAIRERLLRRMVESGGIILAGSDAPGGLLGYGWTMHRELAYFVRAGLTPYQALRTATVNPAAWLGAEDVGTIAVGTRADLVLLEGNPLADIAATTRIAMVASGGRWYHRDDLQQRIAAAERVLRVSAR